MRDGPYSERARFNNDGMDPDWTPPTPSPASTPASLTLGSPAPAGQTLTDERIKAIQTELGFVWHVPADYDRHLWTTVDTDKLTRYTRAIERECRGAPAAASGQPKLAVWYGSMPESNGKKNWTAILYRKDAGGFFGGIADGITIARSEYPDRARYEADRMRHLIGELMDDPDILAYDTDKCEPDAAASGDSAGVPSDHGGPESFARQAPFRKLVSEWLVEHFGCVEADNVGGSEFARYVQLCERAAALSSTSSSSGAAPSERKNNG